MRHTNSRTGSRNFILLEVVALPQLLNLTPRKAGGRTEELSMRKAADAGKDGIIAI